MVRVLDCPDADFHCHTGKRAAANAGYLDHWIEGLPGSSVTSFVGVANPFHWGLPQPGETWSTSDPGPVWTAWSRRAPWVRRFV
ncbi:MAG: hypothetical protein ABJC60_10745 [Actinomycetota bacterium]